MRIGIFTDTYPPYINGVSTSIKMLEEALIKLGHEVFIVTVNPEKMRYSYLDNGRIIKIPGIKTGIYDYRLTSIYPIKAVNRIKEWNLDVIHSHTEFGIGTFSRVISRKFNIPIVHTYHTMYEDYVHYITRGYFNNSAKKIVEHLTKFYCDKTIEELIVPTKKTYDLFKEKYGYTRDIHIIPTGIEIERFYKQNINCIKLNKIKSKLNIKKEDINILFVGRIAEEKNIVFLIKNHSNLIKINSNVKLIIVGDGPDLEKYKDLVNELNLKSSIKFIGKVPWEDVPYYYNLASIFTTASKTETQGLTVIEAMGASIPVVAYNDEAFNKVIKDSYNGFLFNNKKEYISKMSSLIIDKDLREKLGKEAKNDSIKYSSEVFAKSVLKVYESAVKNGKRKKISVK